MTRPTDAEIMKDLRIHAAKLVKATDCPCIVCLTESVPTRSVAAVLAWILGVEIELNTPCSFIEYLTDLYDREDVAKYLHDPRMAEILPAGRSTL